MHPGLKLCAGQAFAEQITTNTTYEVRDVSLATGVAGDVLGRVTITPGAPVVLPAPGFPFQVVTNDPSDHLRIRLRWGTPDSLRRLSLLQFGFNVWRIPTNAAIAGGFNVTPPTPAQLKSNPNFLRFNPAPVMATRDYSPFSGPGGSDDASDGNTYFVADNGGGLSKGPPFIDGTNFYYFITARDILGRDGLVSTGRLATACRRLPPLAPTDPRVQNTVAPGTTNQSRLLITWKQNNGPNDLITEYWVYRWPNPTMAMTNDATPLSNRVAVVTHVPGASNNAYLDVSNSAPAVAGASNYWYTIRAVSQAACDKLLSPHSPPAWGVLRERAAPPATTGELVGSCGTPVVVFQSIATVSNTPNLEPFGWNYRFTCQRRDPGIAWVQFAVSNNFGIGEIIGPLYFPPDGDSASADFYVLIAGTNYALDVTCIVGTYYGRVSQPAMAHFTAQVYPDRQEAMFLAGQLLLTALSSSDPLLDAPTGSVASVHGQVLNFDGTNFTQASTANLSVLSTRNTRADVWLFQTEPFVNRDPGFIASINSPDWSDSLSGLPGALNVVREGDGGTSAGLSSATTTNLGAPPAGSSFGLRNQFNPAISLFSYSGPRAAEAVAVKISPTPGPYVAPLSISFSVLPAGAGVQYRVGAADSWHAYAAAFQLTNDMTIQFYGTNGGARGGLQFASYTLGGATTNPPPPVNLGSSNPPPALPTNAIVLSANGTVFYGRRSANNFGTIWAINLDGSGDTYITTGARPRVSRDGRRLAFLRENNPFGNQGNVWMRDMQSGLETRLFSNPDFVVCYDWEPNAAALLTDYFCNIWDLNTNGGGGLSAVVAGDCYDDAPVRNPVDNRIAFHNVNPSSSVAGLFLTAANGSARQRIISSVAGATWPAWAPNGQWLAFSDGNTSASLDNGTNLWVAQPNGVIINQITALTAPNRLPHGALWSPDGDALVTAGTIFNTNGLWIHSADTRIG